MNRTLLLLRITNTKNARIATLNLSIPDDMKMFIKAKAAEMNTSVSDIFINYIKLLRSNDIKGNSFDTITDEQQAKLKLAMMLAGSIVIDNDSDLDEIRFKYLSEKHLNNNKKDFTNTKIGIFTPEEFLKIH